MDVVASDRQYLGQKNMQKSMLFIYSLAFNKMVFAFNFSVSE